MESHPLYSLPTQHATLPAYTALSSMPHPRVAPFKLDFIIVGGCQYLFLIPSLPCLASLAVAGFSMAIGLALSGHTVRVLEKSPRLRNPPGGIRLTPNVTKILVQWGLEAELRKKGSLVREGSHLWDCKSV
jgi:salicylate hydroxylase